ncbi:MAG: SurA N-terminal domain-containing protein, partial [Planctomycetes bacterium]|nr:SurA N-terminal domain-containing protein [Planctomycetota bacterium]
MTAKSMWKWLRQHEKMILAGIVVFILPAFGFGGIMISWIIRSQEKTVAAVVDGREITVEEFNALKRRFVPLVDSFQRFVAGRYGAQREIKVENPDLWKHVAMVEEAGKSGIRVPETEVREIIEDYPKAYEKLPHLKNAYSFLSQKEILMYAQMLNYHAYFSIAMQDKYTKEKYEKFLTRFQLTDDAFRTTVREILTILKFKYFLWRTAIVPTSRAFDAYKGKHVSVKCNYLRFDREAPAAPEAEIPEKDLLEHYEKNRQTFEEPTRKTVEYLYARVEDLTRRVKLTAEEKRAFYEAEKTNLFRAPPAEKKADEAPGEKKAEAPGGEKKEEGGAGEKKAGPGEGEKKGEAAPGEKKAEAPAPAFKLFEDPDVQAEIAKRLSDRAARQFLEALMGRLSKTLKSLEEEIRRKAHDYPE